MIKQNEIKKGIIVKMWIDSNRNRQFLLRKLDEIN